MTILVQGAMDCELDVLTEYYKPTETRTVSGFVFHVCDYRGNVIVLSKTEVGIMNATAATTVGIYEFEPDLVINQGCAGGHTRDVHFGDIVIGSSAVYINKFYTSVRGRGEGSDSLTWQPSNHACAINATPKYVALAEGVDYDGRKLTGILGSGDLFSKEVDRIDYLHSLFGEVSEDMETDASFTVCERLGIDRAALRIISNNELTGEPFDRGVCARLQKFVIAYIDKIIGCNP